MESVFHTVVRPLTRTLRSLDTPDSALEPLRLRLYSKPTQVLLDASVSALAFFLAYTIRFDGSVPEAYSQQALRLIPFVALISTTALVLTGVYRFVWRWLTARDAAHILRSVVLGAATVALADSLRTILLDQPRIPLGVLVLYPILFYCGCLGLRIVRRMTHATTTGHDETFAGRRRRVVVAGAGREGVLFAGEIGRDSQFDWIGFVDDDPALQGRMILGRRVLGLASEPEIVLAEHGIDELILCMADAPLSKQLELASRWKSAGVAVSTMPGLADLATQKIEPPRPRPVNMEQLLNREVAALAPDIHTKAAYGHATIMVTGGAGSIGSEIVRQLTRLNPKRIVILDKDENAVFETHLALNDCAVPIHAVVASVRDADRIRRVFAEWKPDCVFHAAAYKHVPLMEEFPQEAILNNVGGTNNVLSAAVEHGVKTFVLISTDKAINPASVMGATKKLSEWLVQSYARRYPGKFCAVRFGNVLGSRASVVPIFQNQIREKKTITITHPDVSRYLMTISEATGLVIQAGSVAQSGDICFLDMGEQVRIVDLARQLIELSGLRPEKDVRIEFTGLRRGEKIVEELFSERETGIRGTSYPKVFVVDVDPPAEDFARMTFQPLIDAAKHGDAVGIMTILEQCQIGYRERTAANGHRRSFTAVSAIRREVGSDANSTGSFNEATPQSAARNNGGRGLSL